MNSFVLRKIFACTGFACLFSGLWLNDILITPKLDVTYPSLIIRLVILVVYGLFFFGTFLLLRKAKKSARDQGTKNDPAYTLRSEKRFLTITSVIALACFMVGALILYGAEITGSPIFSEIPAMAWIVMVLLKIVGAPLSVAIIYAFSNLSRSSIIRITMLGFAGALFILVSLDWLFITGAASLEALFCIHLLLFCISFLCGAKGYTSKGYFSPPGEEDATRLITRPPQQIISKGFIAAIVITSIMLGFLRSLELNYDPLITPQVIIVLIIAALIVSTFKWVGIFELFSAALLYVVAGILFAPFLTAEFSAFSPSLTGIGSAFFEVIVWYLTIWAARNCTHSIFAAAGSRFISTLGHFFGSAIAAAEMALIGSGTNTLGRSSLIIVFLFFLLLLYFMRYPTLYLPVLPMSNRPFTRGPSGKTKTTEQDSPKETTPNDPDPPQEDFAAIDDQYWSEPCDYISENYSLTAREGEVLEQLARGRDIRYMEEKFVISRNTLKMHIRNIYQKLDIHNKQDVIELVEEARNLGRQNSIIDTTSEGNA